MSKPNGFLLYSLWIIIVSFVLTVTFAISTNYCQVYDSELNYEYDLRKLIPDDLDIIVVPKITTYNDAIRIQLCSPLRKKCNDEDGFAICLQYENGTEKGIGRSRPLVSNKSGQIIFTFSGILCSINPDEERSHVNYVIIIYLRCDYLAGNDSRPVLEFFNREICKIYMTWNTVLACGPRTHINCTAVHDDELYDLSALTRYSKNYKIRAGDITAPKIVLNVCHSIIRRPGAVCSSEAGACMYDKRLKRYINLGSVQKPLFFDDGHILLEYENGDPCNISNTTSHMVQNYKTTIIFICTTEIKHTVPEFEGVTDECHYQITWNAHEACSIDTFSYDDYDKENTTGDCTITNYDTGSMYNLQPLMNKDYTIEHFGVRYKFSICGPLSDNTCAPGTGLCDIDHGISYGKAHALILWERNTDGPFINYLDGDFCRLYGWPYNTVVRFVCGGEQAAHLPIIMEEMECEMIIYWITDLICEKKVLCNAHNYHAINLTSLMQNTKNYVVKHEDLEFHINICRPLVPTPGLACENGTAVCAVQLGPDNQCIRNLNLGYPVRNPKLIGNLVTVLRYIGGSPCQENQSERLSTNITFICGNDIQGFPVYKGYTDCTHLFEWHTRLACVTMTGSWVPPCTIVSRYSLLKYDLSLLYKEQHKIHYVEGKQGKVYSINICNNENYCNGSVLCDGTNVYGSLGQVIFNYIGGDITLEYLNGSECDDSSYMSKVRLICNKFMGIGIPNLLLETKCSVEFEWETDVICMKLDNPLTTTELTTEVLHTDQEEQSPTKIPVEQSPTKIPVEQSPTKILVEQPSLHVLDVITTVEVVLYIMLVISILILAIYCRSRTQFCARLLIRFFRTYVSRLIPTRYEGSVTYRRAAPIDQISEISFNASGLTIFETDSDDGVSQI